MDTTLYDTIDEMKMISYQSCTCKKGGFKRCGPCRAKTILNDAQDGLGTLLDKIKKTMENENGS
jgi:hypothetical protein